MSMNDVTSDFLTRVRNAYRTGHESVQIRHSVLVESVARILQTEGYIDSVETIGEGIRKYLVVKIRYVNGTSVIQGLQRVSKPSRRVYVGCKEIKPVMNGLGLSILSTPSGVMTDVEARKRRVGGEVLCNIW